MKPLSDAIYTLFTTAPYSDFYNDISGRLYSEEAPEGAIFPYAVFFDVTNDPDWWFGATGPEYLEEFVIQFSLYTEAKNTSSYDAQTVLNNMFTHLKALYDDCDLTITGYNHIGFDRSTAAMFKDEERGIWQYNVDYDVQIQKIV